MSDASTAAPRVSGEHPPGALRNRALLVNFYRREIGMRYLGSATGLAWALLHPLALLGVYAFVFTAVLRVGQFRGASFLLYVAVALWPWLATQDALQRATTSLAGYAALIRKVAFPHELVVYASVAATLSLQLVGYLAALAMLALAGEPIRLEGLLVALPLWIVMATAVTGLALALASLQVFLPDVEHVLMPVLLILTFLTPILYPLDAVPAEWRTYVSANPFAWLVERLRAALIEGQLAPEWGDLLAAALALATFGGGRWLFRRLSGHFEDFV